MQLVLDSHRWVPLPAVGFSANSFGDENQEDVTPPPDLMDHPPLAVFVNGKFLMKLSSWSAGYFKCYCNVF